MVFKLPFLLITHARLKKDENKKPARPYIVYLAKKEEAKPKAGRGWVLLCVFPGCELWPL